MKLSIIIVTHNRCQALANTLNALMSNDDLPHNSMEIIVVDNASTDGTAAMLAARNDSRISRIGRRRNEGVSARNHGFAVARGEFVLLIDDDSYPLDDAISQSLAYLQMHELCAAVVGRIVLPNGQLEASALPSVVANGAVVLRKRAIDEIGGFPREFFRQAEEYDFSFRIWNAGYEVARFEDVVYRHDKVAGVRSSSLIHRMDLRNNLILLSRYFPSWLRHEYRRDWTKRYMALARQAGNRRAAQRGQVESLRWRTFERLKGRPRMLNAQAIESILGIESQTLAVSKWVREHGVRRIVIADFGKNMFATWRAVMESGLQVKAIADPNPAFTQLTYRDIPIFPDHEVLPERCDGVVLSNVNPAQVERRTSELERVFDGPILTLWEGTTIKSDLAVRPMVVEFPLQHQSFEAA